MVNFFSLLHYFLSRHTSFYFYLCIINIKKDFYKLVAGILITLITLQWLKDNKVIEFSIIYKNLKKNKKNYIWKLTIIVIGLLILTNMESPDLLKLIIALEMQAFTVYIIISMKKENLLSSEEGLKYFLIGAIASACIILATALIYELVNKTNLIEIIEILPLPKENYLFILGGILLMSGLLFKIGFIYFDDMFNTVFKPAKPKRNFYK